MNALTASIRRVLRLFELPPVVSTGTYAGMVDANGKEDLPARVSMICNKLHRHENTLRYALILAQHNEEAPVFIGHCRAAAQERRQIRATLNELAGLVGAKHLSRRRVMAMRAQALSMTDRRDARLWLFNALAADASEASYLQALRAARVWTRATGGAVTVLRDDYALSRAA